ncbi:MAG: MFS transporter [Rhodospirillales bacterium]|nr:MAG: MFS transporter [Rhodospirillales bacterium]
MLLLRVFVPFALGYFLSYLFRVVNAVIAPDLVREVGLDAASLGLLTSAYFLTFAIFQIPLGVLLDRFGPRRTEAWLLLFAAAGAVWFALAESTGGLVVGRALIGLGVSACLMAAFKAFVEWFPRDRLPLINGCQMAAGGLGALAGTLPVEAALRLIDWRSLFLILAALTVLAALVIARTVPERHDGRVQQTIRDQLRGVAAVFRSGLFRRVAPLTVSAQATFLAVQSLWAGPWLLDVAGLDRAAVAEVLLAIAAAMVTGFLGLGWLASRMAALGLSSFSVAVGGIALFMVAQTVLVGQWVGVSGIAWIAFGFFGTAGILPYAALSQRFPAHLAGRLNTSLNLLVFVSAFALQWGIGIIIDQWPLTADGGYAPAGYAAAFAAMLALQGLALGWFALYRRQDVPEG